MRFNGKELSALALQPSHKFDKEGVLVVREKQDGIFRRGEVHKERWCRLRGNMLFYFKNRDQYSEPTGVIVLEQCAVHLDASGEDGPFSITIVFETDGGRNTTQFYASSASERDSWIQALHMASYEYMRSQLRTLQDRLAEKHEINSAERRTPESLARVKLPEAEEILEISLACDNLMCDGDGQPPNPVIFVQFMPPNQFHWTSCSQTEIVQRSSNPCFLTTVNLRVADILQAKTKIKLSAYDMRERLTSTMTCLGNAIFPAESLSRTEKSAFRLPLLSGDGTPVGFVSISAWQMASGAAPEVTPVDTRYSKPSSNNDHFNEIVGNPSPRHMLPLKNQLPPFGNLHAIYDNITSQTYRFHTGLGADLGVHEIMAESKFCYTFPQEVVQLFIQEEKDLLHALTSINNLKDEWSKRQTELLDRHLHLINTYTMALHYMDSHSGSSFKRSVVKSCMNLEFVPVNLHLQRIRVHDDSIKKQGIFDVITVGAFAAHSRSYRHGGLSRFINVQSQRLVNAAETVAKIKQLKSCLGAMLDQLVRHAQNKTADLMYSTMMDISTRAHQLIGICETVLIDEACALFEELRNAHDDDDATAINNLEAVNGSELLKTPVNNMKRKAKERSHSLDGSLPAVTSESPRLESGSRQLERLATTNANHVIDTVVTSRSTPNKKWDVSKKENSSPRNFRRRAVARMTRHGSLKEDKVKPTRASASPEAKRPDVKAALELHHVPEILQAELNDVLRVGEDGGGDRRRHASATTVTSHLVQVNNARNEEKDSGAGTGVAEESCPSPARPRDRSCIIARSRSPEEPEPWDLTQLNIEASVMCMASKVKGLCKCASGEGHDGAHAKSGSQFAQINWADELTPSIRKLTQALECLLKTAHLTHIIYLLMEPTQITSQQAIIQHRRDIVFTNALTSVVVALMSKLWCHTLDSVFLTRLSKVGLLAQFEGLLSCHGDEMGMLEDMVVALEDVSRVLFRVEEAKDEKAPSVPKVEGSRLLFVVRIPIRKSLFEQLPPEAAKGFSFYVTPAFFNIGINEQATIAERDRCSLSCMHSVPLSARKSIACMYTTAPTHNRFGDISLQDKINKEGLDRMKEFYSKYRQVPITAEKTRRSSISESTTVLIPDLLEKLGTHVHARRNKNVEILHLSARITRLIGGLRFTSCKSAKDRTGMSVTLEQCMILKEHFDLADPEYLRAIECMRGEGTRRDNTFKNTEIRKYAFNSLHVMALPRLYRPPGGTYGNVQT